MVNNNKLNLIVVGDDQRYAERLVTLLSHYYDEVNLGFLDDKKELIKLLRHNWDVLVFARAYDMSFTDVVGVVQEQNIDLPLICLMSDDTATTGRNEDGLPTTIDGNMVKALLADNEVQVVIATCVLHDNLKSRREMAKLKHIISESEQRANILIKNSKSAVAYIDEGIHIYANDPYIELFGFNSVEDLLGVPVIDLIAGVDNVKAFKQFLRRFSKGNRDKVEFNFESQRKDGSTFEATLQLAAATFEGDPVVQIIIQQNTSTDAAEIAKKLAAAARQDSLTGLMNRRGFEDYIEQLYPQIKEDTLVASLLFASIDDIGKINSNLGIQGVDAVIKQVSRILDEEFEVSDVSRFGDSNFMILVTDMNQPQLIKLVDSVREKISSTLIEVDKRTVTTTLTFGLVMLDSTAPKPSILINRVIDTANKAYQDSNNIGNVIGVYDASLHVNEDDSLLAEYMQKALTQGFFKLMYQPIYDIETDTSLFFEVYLNLALSDGTLMRSDEFLAVAKNHNLLDKIDRWVLINACKQLSLVRKHAPEARLLVRLSSESLANKQLPGMVSQLIKAIGGSPNALMLQFNEQDLVDYLSVAKKQLGLLKQVNCGVSVYNFGVTAKTMDLIEYIEPTMVRLAKSYVTDLTNPANTETIKTLIAKASSHNTPVLMPYIEEAAAMSVAWSVGARYLQGFYLQEPAERMVLPIEETTS